MTRAFFAATGLAAVAVFGLAVADHSPGVTGNRFEQTILVANRAALAPDAIIDPQLINPWGLALRPPGAGGHFWISNAGTLTTSLFIGDLPGQPLRQDGLKIVFLDGPLISYEDGLANPTGQVYNAATDFAGQPIEFPVSGPASNLSSGRAVSIGAVSGSAKFVFVTTDGTINAWRASTAESMDRAVIVKDYSAKGVDQIPALKFLPAFTGVAMTTEKGAVNRLYVTDFQNDIVRVIDNQWRDITATVPFVRPSGLADDWHAYNVQQLDGRLYVTYAKINLRIEEPAYDVPGEGFGKVVAYDYDGRILQEFADAGKLNSPWGVTIAPASFGPFGRTLLVANFGDGSVAVFDLETGQFRDYLRDPTGAPIAIDGLWALAFGNGVSLGETDSLYFTAGPNVEQDGIFGRLRFAGAAGRPPSPPR